MLKIHFSLAGSCYNKLIICEPENSRSQICEPATTSVNDYKEMIKSFQKLSINPTIKEELSDIRQRMHCISVWEAGIFARADLV